MAGQPVSTFAPPYENEFSAGLVAPGEAQPGILYYQAERAVVAALRHGWEYLRDNPEQMVNFTRFADDVERAAMQNLFTRDGGQYLDPRRITVAYPLIDSSAPQVTVMVEGETHVPNGEFLADVLGAEAVPGVVTAGGPDRGLQKGAIQQRSVAIWMASPHPDVVGYLDGIVDAIMFAMDYWFVQPANVGGAGLVSVVQGNKSAMTPDPRSDTTGNRLWAMTSSWIVTGFSGTSLAIPPPKTRAVVLPTIESSAGVQGRVVARGR